MCDNTNEKKIVKKTIQRVSPTLQRFQSVYTNYVTRPQRVQKIKDLERNRIIPSFKID
jgi:hypothetical protein